MFSTDPPAGDVAEERLGCAAMAKTNAIIINCSLRWVTGLTLEELWLPYFALGGDVGKVEVEANLTALMPMSASQHDMLAHAINERFDEIAPPRAPYRSEVPRVPDSDELP